MILFYFGVVMPPVAITSCASILSTSYFQEMCVCYFMTLEDTNNDDIIVAVGGGRNGGHAVGVIEDEQDMRVNQIDMQGIPNREGIGLPEFESSIGNISNASQEAKLDALTDQCQGIAIDFFNVVSIVPLVSFFLFIAVLIDMIGNDVGTDIAIWAPCVVVGIIGKCVLVF